MTTPQLCYSIRVARGTLAQCRPVERHTNHVEVEGLERPVSVFPSTDVQAVRLVAIGTDGAFTVSSTALSPALVIEPTLTGVGDARVFVTASRGHRATLHLSNARLGVRLAIRLGVLDSAVIRQINELCRSGLVTGVALAAGRLSLVGDIRVQTAARQGLFRDFRIELGRGVCRIEDPRVDQVDLSVAA